MKYDKNVISNTAQNLRSKASGLANVQTSLSQVSPKKCSSSFYSKRSSLVRRLNNVQNEINSLSVDISNAASKMSSDDVQNAYYIRQVFTNRTSKITYGQNLFSTGNTSLRRSGSFGDSLLFAQTEMNRRSVASLGNASKGSTPWYAKAGDFLKSGATSFGKKVGEFGSNIWNGASNFFSNAGKWGSERLNELREWGKSAGEYTWKSITKFVLGDYSDDNITALSFIGNIAAGLFDVDLPLDVRDLVHDIQYWGEGDNFGIYFALDVVAVLPVIGAIKYCKYVDDVADGAKDLGKVIEVAGDVGKYSDGIADAADNAKDLGKVIEAAGDVGKYSDDVADVVDNAKDLGKAVDAAAEATKTGDVLWETARRRKYIISDDVFKIVDDSGEVLNEVKNVERVSDFCYVKKSAEELVKQRKEFNTITKSEFLKKLAKENPDDLKRLGLADDQIKNMFDGIQPKGFEVHHKFSLDDGGNNSFDNLILIDDRSHEIFTGYQNAFTKTDKFKSNGSTIIDWIYPNGSIYFPE